MIGAMPEMWKNGPAHSDAAAIGDAVLPVFASIALVAPRSPLLSAKWMMLRCDNVAPFGRPVVPLVNRMMKGSSSSIGVSGSARLAARRDLGRELLPAHDGRVDLRAGFADALEARLVADQHLRLGELHAVGELRTRSTSRSDP